MDRETIEKAAKEYASRHSNGFKPETGLEEGIFNAFLQASIKPFVDGAQWRINAVWHDASEKPNKNQLVLFECRKTYGKGYSVNFGENYELMKNVIVRWAYVIDLLPERKEEIK